MFLQSLLSPNQSPRPLPPARVALRPLLAKWNPQLLLDFGELDMREYRRQAAGADLRQAPEGDRND